MKICQVVTESLVYMLVYVDDIIITSNSKVLTQSMSVFSLKDLGQLDYFLEVKNKDNGSMSLSQGKYIRVRKTRDLLTKTNMLAQYHSPSNYS
jgi:tRNA(Met) C34 N-acetyltransferase TmcA